MPWLGADHGAVGIEHRMVRLRAEDAHKAETAFPATVQIMAYRFACGSEGGFLTR
jgi:hypothetical protein